MRTNVHSSLESFPYQKSESLALWLSWVWVTSSSTMPMLKRWDKRCVYGNLVYVWCTLISFVLQIEGDELKQATFKPKTTNYPVESRLKILADPEAYMERVHKEQEIKEEQYTSRLQQKEKQKLEGCTFRPEIHDAPTYVKRIARSMALARGHKSRTSISPPKKPEWL